MIFYASISKGNAVKYNSISVSYCKEPFFTATVENNSVIFEIFKSERFADLDFHIIFIIIVNICIDNTIFNNSIDSIDQVFKYLFFGYDEIRHFHFKFHIKDVCIEVVVIHYTYSVVSGHYILKSDVELKGSVVIDCV